LCVPLLLFMFAVGADAKSEQSPQLLAPLALDAGGWGGSDLVGHGSESTDTNDDPDAIAVSRGRTNTLSPVTSSTVQALSRVWSSPHPHTIAPRGPPIS
jgi:hypothetical protein